MTNPASYDPFSPDVIADPYPWYRAMHEHGPVSYLDDIDVWVLVRHRDVSAAARDHARLSSAEGVAYPRIGLPMMLTMDPPDHERLRRIVGRAFAPREVQKLRSSIEAIVSECLEGAEGEVDLMERLAVPVPIRVMAAILGVGEEDIPELRRTADDLIEGFGPLGQDGSEDAFARVSEAILRFHSYFAELVAAKRAEPGDDLVTELLHPADEGTLRSDELLWFCLLLLVAGIETTTNLIGNMTLALLSHPEAWGALVADRGLVGSAVAESLRFDPPIQGFFRTARSAYLVDGIEIGEGSRVLLSFGAANRDPTHYPDPDRFVLGRNPTDHLAFGAGIHRCLGAGLADLEGRVVLEAMLDRFEAIEQTGPVVRGSNPVVRGPRSLPMRLIAKIQV